MNKVKYGIIGLGFFGEKHAEVLSSMPQVELAAVSTRRDERRKEVADRFGVTADYKDYHDLLADDNVEAVSIVTHVADHDEIAVAALEAGKHVFLEKPMAHTVEACDRILAAAEKAEGKFMVGHICRFDPRVNAAREAVLAGRIGDIVTMHAARNLPGHVTGGGVLDQISPIMGDGIHDIDLMLWLTGAKIKSVFAKNVRVRENKYPDIGWAMYTLDTGAVCVTETVWCLPDTSPFAIDARMEIIGSKGACYIDCGNAGVELHDTKAVSRPETVYWPMIYGQRIGVLRTELEYFMNCVLNDTEPEAVPPAESRQAVAAVCAAEQSAAEGREVTL